MLPGVPAALVVSRETLPWQPWPPPSTRHASDQTSHGALPRTGQGMPRVITLRRSARLARLPGCLVDRLASPPKCLRHLHRVWAGPLRQPSRAGRALAGPCRPRLRRQGPTPPGGESPTARQDLMLIADPAGTFPPGARSQDFDHRVPRSSRNRGGGPGVGGEFRPWPGRMTSGSWNSALCPVGTPLRSPGRTGATMPAAVSPSTSRSGVVAGSAFHA